MWVMVIVIMTHEAMFAEINASMQLCSWWWSVPTGLWVTKALFDINETYLINIEYMVK